MGTKQTLKEIREAIKNEKYSEAIEKCENVLREDSKNYMAFLLIGAAYQNSNKNEAARHLRKAVEYSPGPPTVALQGLANCAAIEELPQIYKQLLQLLPDKRLDYYEKLYSIASKAAVTNECLDIFKSEAVTVQAEFQHHCYKYIGKIWIDNNIEVADDEPMYKTVLEELLKDKSCTSHLAAAKIYLKLLYKLKEFESCTKTACNLVELYPDYIGAYEWICKIYCENYKQENSILENALSAPIEHYAQKLSELNENSSLAMLVRAIDLYAEEQYVAARELLYRARLVQPNYAVLLELLAQTEMHLDAYTLAIPLWQKLGKQNYEYALCLSYQTDEMQLLEAAELLEKMDSTRIVINALARCYKKLAMNDKLMALELDDMAKAEYLMTPGDGITLLQAQSDLETDFAALLLIGKLHFQLKNYSTALAYMLKATRMQPQRAECFLYLGKIYYATGDIMRARKCFEKCVNLNPACEEGVNNLSAIYLQNNEDQHNEALLLNALKYVNGINSKHIHYKMGLHYLCMNKWDDAIHSFRTALKYDVNCGMYWESLGDAYCERGSYNSAIRVFQKLLEMQPTNRYAKLKIALIRTTVRMYPEAIEDFQNLLQAHPNYLPGLKGAAEAHIGLAKNLKLEHRYGRCKAHLTLAVLHLERAFVSLSNREMIWLWRLFGNVFQEIARLPYSLANLEISGKLVQRNEETIFYNREDLLKMSVRFYTCALKLKQNTFLWYELALGAYFCAKYIQGTAEEHLQLAERACKVAIKEQTNRWQNWNLMGVIYLHPANNKLSLAQHCFIQALNLDRKSYTCWTNLGVIYLHLNEIKLANQAFQRAQQSSPIYQQAWIGQAMIAESIGEEEEALDLFRHCQQFDYHSESAIGYAHWVCQILNDTNKSQQPHYKHAINSMYADIVALDAINWYYANEQNDASVAGLSFQGFLNVRQNLYKPAIRAYELAAKNATIGAERDHIYTNLGYLYLKVGKTDEAIVAFNMITQADFKPIIGLALAYSRAGQHQEAYTIYNSVLNNVAGVDDAKAANILVSMASIIYAFQGEADTKTLLYQCILLKESPMQALYSACALGILHADEQLSETILMELKKYEDNEQYCADVAYLTAQYYLAIRKAELGLAYLKSRVRVFPHCAAMRKVLANFLLDNFATKRQYHVSTSQIALSAVTLSHRSQTKKNTCHADAECLLIASRALSPIDKTRSCRLLQKAIHLYPQNQQAWRELLAM